MSYRRVLGRLSSPLLLVLMLGNAQAQEYSRDEVLRLAKQAFLAGEKGRYAEGAAQYERILPSAEVHFGRDGENTASILHNLAGDYNELGEHAKAEPLYLRSIRIYENRLGKNHPRLAASLHNLANLYWATSQFAKAEPLYQRGLQIHEATFGADHPEVATSLNNLGVLYESLGQYAKADAFYRRSLRIREVKLAKDDPELAISFNNLANLYVSMGKYAQAEPFFHRSLETYYAKPGRDHLEVAQPINGLAGLYEIMGQYAKAEPLYQRSVQIRETWLGKDHPQVALALNNLGILYDAMRQYAKAEPLFQRSLRIFEAKLGKDHPSVGTCLNNLATLYLAMDEYAKALPYCQRSLECREARLGKDHPDVAMSLNNLGYLYLAMGEHAKAAPLFQRGFRIYEAKLGGEHPNAALPLNGLGQLYASQKNWQQAIRTFHQARQASTAHLATVLPVLTEKEQLVLLQSGFEHPFALALSLGFGGPVEAGTASAEWLLNGKALAHQTLAEQALLTRDSADPEARALADRLQATRSELAAQVHRRPKPGLEQQYQKDLSELRSREQDLAQKLARAVGRPHRSDRWVTLDELRATLPPTSVFVEIARFRVQNFEANESKGYRYAAWITPPKDKGDVIVIDLGEADRVEGLVAEARKTLLESARDVTKIGETQATQTARKSLEALSAKVLHPLLPSLETFDEWIVCPDGALWLTPWNALVLPKGEFVVDKHLLRHVVSGRDLVLEQAKSKGDVSYLFADPDYDLSPGKIAATGVRGLTSPLFGQRLRGTIGSWNVSFEFLRTEVIIYDEDAKGEVAGKGTWQHEGDGLTIKTGLSHFAGTFSASEIRGQRSRRNDDDSVSRDEFRMTLPEDRGSGTASNKLSKAPRLPGTALEAEAVRPHLAKWLGVEPRVFLEGDAGEARVKSVKSPRVLALATHGYFLPAQEVESKGRLGLDLGEGKRAAVLFEKSGETIENPLLRCGLLLAGCNKRHEAKQGEDDGILTGLEIVGMDLRGTELVVLSACETGLGDVRSGEGVAGLRQAFQLAGAKVVLASLWQVPDRETALLMNAFYGELTKGKSQAAALREAQLSRIASRKASFGAAHPFFWAAFTLTSRGAE